MAGHRIRRAVAAGALGAVLLGCSAPASDPDQAAGATATAPVDPSDAAGRSSAGPPTEGGPEPPAADQDELLRRVEEAAAGARATISAVVLGPRGGTLVSSAAAAEPVDAASLVKLLVVHQVLARAPGGPGALDQETSELLEQAVTVSDDDAMNRLWVEREGIALVPAAAQTFGMVDTAPPADRSQWGATTTTAVDVARFLQGLTDRRDDPAAAQLLDWMRAAGDTAADGFDQRFGLLAEGLPAGAGEVAAKQAWACCPAGRRQLHSAGVLPDGRVVALLAEAPQGTGYAQLAAALDGAAAVLVEGTG